MRDILFRGKTKRESVNQFWIYGGIVHQTDYYGEEVDRWFIIDGTDTQDYDIGYEYEVIPESIGQYTGLYDKNGNELYEGDIVRAQFVHNGSVHTFVVEFDAGSFLFNNGFISVPFREIAHIKLRGNIYDNPKLINHLLQLSHS